MSAALAAWDGYGYDVPAGTRPEAGSNQAELDLRRLLYARVLSQLSQRPTEDVADDLGAWGSSLLKWTSQQPRYSVLHRARSCGRGAGLRRVCEGDHSFFTPLGCGSPWCLRCSGVNADLRAARVHRDIRALADVAADLVDARPPVVRIVLTLSDEARAPVIMGGREAAGALIDQARRVILEAAGSNGTLPLMLTLHPTSSAKPWLKRPHVEAFALWLDLDGDQVRTLSWSEPGRPLDAEAVRESWSEIHSGSVNLHASYYSWNPSEDRYERPGRQQPQSLGSALRYALRGFNEDVWWATAEGTLGVPGGSMGDLLDYRRVPALRGRGSTSGEVVDGLESAGGVLMWPRMHRVRRSGALAARGFRARLAELHAAAGSVLPEWSPVCKCPECGLRLAADTYEDDDGRRQVCLIRVEEAERDGLGLLPARGRARGVFA